MHRKSAGSLATTLSVALTLAHVPIAFAQGPAGPSSVSVAPSVSQQNDATEAGADEVTLKNGGLVRGRVTSLEPGSKVTILELGGKEARTIPWSEVADVQLGKYSAPEVPRPSGYALAPPPPPAPVLPARPPATTDQLGVVRLFVSSPEPVRIYQTRTVGTGVVGGYGFVARRTEFVCDSPCGTVVDARDGGDLEVRGTGIPSRKFEVDGMRGDVDARVDPGSSSAKVGSFITMGLGGVASFVGIFLLVAPTDVSLDGGVEHETVAGAVSLGVGVTTVLIGLGVLLGSRTSVDVEPRPTRAKTSASTPRYWLGEF